jgi:hypothetical protein
MSILPLPQRMPLRAAISYVAERCQCRRPEASKAIHAALSQGTLQAIANRLILDPVDQDQVSVLAKFVTALGEDKVRALTDTLVRDPDVPTHLSEYADTGLRSVPSKLWAGYPWTAFDKRCRPRGDANYREQTDGGGEVGPVWNNPTIATADIGAWLDRDDGSHKVPAGTPRGLIGTIYEAIQLKPGAFGFAIDLKLIFDRVWRYFSFR